MKRCLPVVLFTGLVLTACSDNTPEGKIIQARHEHFHAISTAAKGIGDQLKASTPDLGEIKTYAATIAGLAPQVKDWFPVGTGPQDGKRTDAKAEVWTQRTDFDQAATRFADAATALKAAADAGNAAAIGASAKSLNGTCKSCHDKFRKD